MKTADLKMQSTKSALYAGLARRAQKREEENYDNTFQAAIFERFRAGVSHRICALASD
jgi:hypothetical protein